MGYTSKQETFISEALSGKNIFLTGKAGTGKSFIVKELMKTFKEQGRKFIAVAPTGIAANNIGGQTIHSLFGVNPFGISDFDSCNRLKSEKRRMLKKVETIIIDEVSMLRPDLLDAMNWTLIKNGCDKLSTKQVIFIGDLAQLPPVLSDNDRAVLFRTYDGEQFTYAKVYNQLQPQVINLDEVVRQNDPEFIANLNIVRDGGKSDYFKQFVSADVHGIVLAPHNATVQKYNEAGLAQQQGEMFTFLANVEGNVKAEDFNLESEVRVKTGCKVMYLANSKNNPLVNGTLGIFVEHKGCYYIRVGEIDYALDRMKFTKKEYVFDEKKDELVLTEIGSIEQYPIKLAYALSIHKSQGLTFENITLDLSRPCFQRGQLYVGLSRVTGPNGLKIKVS